MEVHDIVQETRIKTIPKKKNAKKQNGCLRRPYQQLWKEEKRKEKEKRKDKHLNADLQRIARRDKKAFLSDPGGSDGKASACKVGDPGSIPGSGRSPGEGNGNPLQHSCLENPMDGGAWQATVHGAAKSWTRLSDFTHFSAIMQRNSGKQQTQT